MVHCGLWAKCTQLWPLFEMCPGIKRYGESCPLEVNMNPPVEKFSHPKSGGNKAQRGKVTLVYLNTVIRWTRLTRQKSKWVDSLYLYYDTHI